MSRPLEDILILLLRRLLWLDGCLSFEQLLLVLLLLVVVVALSHLHGLVLRQRLLKQLLATKYHGYALMSLAAPRHTLLKLVVSSKFCLWRAIVWFCNAAGNEDHHHTDCMNAILRAA